MADDLSRQLERQLRQYAAGIAKETREAVTDVAKEMNVRIKAVAPKREGKYKRAMRIKDVENTPLSLVKLWYVAAPHYRLTHLLEKGHNKKNGGFVPGIPHIEPAEKWAVEELTKRIEEGAKHAP